MDAKQISDMINLVFQVLMLILPIAAVLITWFLRTYVKSANTEKTIAAIMQLSEAASRTVQDMGDRKELDKYLKMWNMPEDVRNSASEGLQKLNLASKWASGEFARIGIKMTDEEAKAWIASEYQKRMEGIGLERDATARTSDAVNLLRTLQQSGLISLPADASQAALLTSKIAEWATAQPATGATSLPQAGAPSQSQAQPPEKPRPSAELSGPSVEAQLAQLATQSVQYVEQLKASYKGTLSETDIAAAWVLTEVTKQGLPVTTDQIARAVRAAFESKRKG
jgi:hypothetical protein